MMEQKNDILNKEKIMEKTVEDLEQYYRFPSNDYLMLSELIDNSISSYIGESEENSIKGLKIDITVDRTNKGNYKLILIDNANGMDAVTLENAIYFGNPKKLEKSTSLNVYGVGLKQSAFFAGRRLDVLTKIKNSHKPLKTYIDLTELEKTDSKKIVFTISETEENLFIDGEKLNSGTKIVISHLRKARYTMYTKKNLFIQSLGWKYNRYIEQGLIIMFHYITLEKTSSFTEQIKPTRPKAENYHAWVEAVKKKEKNKVIDIVERMEIEMNSNNGTNSTEFDNFMGKLMRNHGNNDLNWNITIEVINNIKIFGKIGILAHPITVKNTEHKSQTYVKYNGFTLFQKGRAIKCGPNEAKYDVKTYNLIAKDISGGQNQKRRWFGEFDLDPLMEGSNQDKYIELDSNKRDIKWLDETAEKNFEDGIKTFMNRFDKLLTAFNTFQNDFTSVKTNKTKAAQNNIAHATKTSSKLISNANIIKSESNDIYDAVKYTVEMPGITKKIIVNVAIKDVTNHEIKFINYQRQKNDNDGNYIVDIAINADHEIWKPLLGEEVTSENVLISMHKLAITQGLTQWLLEYISTSENENHNIPDILFQYRNKNYTEICSIVANNIFSTN